MPVYYRRRVLPFTSLSILRDTRYRMPGIQRHGVLLDRSSNKLCLSASACTRTSRIEDTDYIIPDLIDLAFYSTSLTTISACGHRRELVVDGEDGVLLVRGTKLRSRLNAST
jgi:hypothetical protein